MEVLRSLWNSLELLGTLWRYLIDLGDGWKYLVGVSRQNELGSIASSPVVEYYSSPKRCDMILVQFVLRLSKSHPINNVLSSGISCLNQAEKVHVLTPTLKKYIFAFSSLSSLFCWWRPRPLIVHFCIFNLLGSMFVSRRASLIRVRNVWIDQQGVIKIHQGGQHMQTHITPIMSVALPLGCVSTTSEVFSFVLQFFVTLSCFNF